MKSGSPALSVEPLPVVIGRVLAPHGVRGWLKFRSFTEDPATCFTLSPWLLVTRPGDVRALEVTASQSHGDHFLVRVAGIDDRDAAQQLAGCEVVVPAASLPEPAEDEIYWRDLRGMRVRTLAGDSLGNVKDIFDNGAHPVLVVASADRERLIPFVDAIVRSVDEASRELVVDWAVDWE
ncbi:MAG: 16S rRNA processing protein RimM [Pseudomonadales bacterium]|nr:16S rRNA processing protein RimM [Pseudomonadales bacterium]MCP5182778.1 16S rRNA processing protein RimM [Pseudomonadales bacterium]